MRTNKLNYKNLMDKNPTSYGTVKNSKFEIIEFFEDPIYGEDAQVICVDHKKKLAEYSTFFDTDDMENLDGDYVPSFIDGDLFLGEFRA